MLAQIKRNENQQETLRPDELPPEILQAIRGSFENARYIAVVPNSSAELLTEYDINEIPPGYIVILSFDPVNPKLNPFGWSAGKVFPVR